MPFIVKWVLGGVADDLRVTVLQGMIVMTGSQPLVKVSITSFYLKLWNRNIAYNRTFKQYFMYDFIFQACLQWAFNRVMNQSQSTKMNHMSLFVMLIMLISGVVCLRIQKENLTYFGQEPRKYISCILFWYRNYFFLDLPAVTESLLFLFCRVFPVMKMEELRNKEMAHQRVL